MFVFVLNFLFASAQYDFDFVKSFPINGNVYNNEKIWLKDNTFLVPINFSTQNYTLDNGVLVPNPNYQVNSQQTKILILRYNEDAQLLDYFTLNSTGYEYLRDITLDKNDNMYLSIDVNPGYQLDGVQYFLNSTNTLQKHLLLKVTSTRNPSDNSITRTVTWKKTIEGNTGTPSVIVSPNDNVYFSTKIDQANLIVDGITYSNPSPHQSQSVLARMIVGKFNKGGLGLDWITSSTNSTTENFQYPVIYNITSPLLRLDSQENLYMVNSLYGSKTTFGNTTLMNSLGDNKISLIMVKYSPLGQVVWAKTPTVSQNSLTLQPVQLEIDEDDNLYLLEQYMPGAQGINQVNHWGTSYSTNKEVSAILKFDSNGSMIWSKFPQVLNVNEHIIRIGYFKIVNNKILAFGLFNGNFDYGDQVVINTNGAMKWVGLELERFNGNIDSFNVLNVSGYLNPIHLFGMDSNNRLWFTEKTMVTGTFNFIIGSLNYSISANFTTNRLVFYRSTAVTLGNDKPFEASFSVYPNPTIDALHVQGENQSNYIYQIFDIVGRLQKSGNLQSQHIDVKELASGNYLLKILDKDNSSIQQTIKFVKK